MITKKYKTGGFVLKIISPTELSDSRPFCDFLYDGEEEDYTAEIESVKSLPDKIDGAYYESDEMTASVQNGERRCYYKNRRENGFYACRITKDNEKFCKILIPEKYAQSLWTRVVFSVIGIEEIAAVNGAAVFHASVVEKNGEAILFTGKCGAGKSTQASLWEKYADAEIINGDKALLLERDGRLFVSGLPFSGSSGICKNRILPVKAVVDLGKAKQNEAVKQSASQSFFTLLKNTYEATYSAEIRALQTEIVHRLSQCTEVYGFVCLPDESAVKYLEKVLC